ncbi:MAG: ABC transporter substrate-binding protein [Holosporales bacterium]|jgi:putative ABC transport system substrate-binding protein|nr:ABC transporter substrate-binding protein [Holosporales bacterium]
MFKKSISKYLIAFATLAAAVNANNASKNDCFKVYICKAAEIEALNSVVKGIQDYLGNDGVQYKIETCQGNPSLALQIVSKFIASQACLIVTVGTTPSQIAYKFAKEGKIKALVFTAVTDPLSIASSFNNSNTTGVSDFVSSSPQIETFKKIQPSLKRLGIIYNTGEANSVATVKDLRKATSKHNVELVEQGVQKSSDIPQALTALLSKNIDAIFINNDNAVLEAAAYIVKICVKRKIPVYVSDTDEVSKGCLAALGPNQYELGRQTGKMIEKIKNGTNINDIKVERPTDVELFVNLRAASKLGITVPDEVLKNANKITEQTC